MHLFCFSVGNRGVPVQPGLSGEDFGVVARCLGFAVAVARERIESWFAGVTHLLAPAHFDSEAVRDFAEREGTGW